MKTSFVKASKGELQSVVPRKELETISLKPKGTVVGTRVLWLIPAMT